VKLLNEVAIPLFVDAIERALSIHGTPEESIDYVIPHISSMYFYNVLAKELEERGINLPTSKWFTNLTTVGNIGAAAIFAALDELLKTKKLDDGEKILLLVPESGRFSYGVVLLTVRKKLC
jgi:3-oxoacyl-[acyl-carrier-protein] synthase-3